MSVSVWPEATSSFSRLLLVACLLLDKHHGCTERDFIHSIKNFNKNLCKSAANVKKTKTTRITLEDIFKNTEAQSVVQYKIFIFQLHSPQVSIRNWKTFTEHPFKQKDVQVPFLISLHCCCLLLLLLPLPTPLLLLARCTVSLSCSRCLTVLHLWSFRLFFRSCRSLLTDGWTVWCHLWTAVTAQSKSRSVHLT